MLPATLAVCAGGLTAQDLAHRWSFTTLADSQGGANAVLEGTASLSGGQLILPGGAARSNYARVPIGNTLGNANSVTVECWFTTTVAQNWAKVWMFGTQGGNEGTSGFIDFTPQAGVTGSPPSIGQKGISLGQTTTREGTNPPTLPLATQKLVTAVFDEVADKMTLYIDGVEADSAVWTGTVASIGNSAANFIGAPVHYGDNCFNGSVNELRIWKGAMSQAQITANATAGPDTVPAHNPHLRVAESFRASTATSPVALSIPLNNPGPAALVVSGASVATGDEFRFSVGGTFPLNIAAGATVNLPVNFDPEGESRTFTTVLTINSNDSFVPARNVPLIVEAGQPDISLPAVTSFGPVANSAALQTYNVTVSNTGTGPLTISGASLLPGVPAPTYVSQFAITQNYETTPLVIAAGATGTIPVTFDPAFGTAGIKHGILQLLTNDNDEDIVTTRLEVTVTGSAASESPPVLAHRWSFDNLTDSVGGATAVLNGTASVSGGNLVLLGGGTRTNHASIPIGKTIARSSSLTIDAWFTTTTDGDWSKVWMFGTSGPGYGDIAYMDFVPRSGGGEGNVTTASFKAPGFDEANTRAGTNQQMTAGTPYHVTVVYDSVADLISIYVNGQLSDTGAWTGEISQMGNTLDNFIGAAVFFGDQDWKGTVDEFRIYRGALTASQVTASHSGGVSTLPDVSGGGGTTTPIVIGTVQISGGNIVLGGVTGLVAGQQYHLQTGVALNDFVAVPGSTFTGGGTIPTVPVNGPKRFVRIASGAAP